ncbi:MAG: SIMPL domain-containing protein, partial [Pseudomonadota bacterium]
MSNESKVDLTLGALLLAVGIAVGGYFISETLYKSKVALNTADVKGLAERRVEADTAYWTIQYIVTGSDRSEIPKLYEESESDQQKIIVLLKDSGFSDEEIKPGVINYVKQEFRD